MQCRTTLLADEVCVQPGHRVVSLATPEGRQVLNDRAWDLSGIHEHIAATAKGIDVPTPAGELGAFTGRVVADHWLPEPFTEHPCVAFCVQLELTKPPGAITLRDAPTIGFTVRADDGTQLHIDRGRIDMRLLQDHKRYVKQGLAEYMISLDPQRTFDQPLDPLPYDHVALGLVRVGDRLSVHNPRTELDPNAAEVSYRSAPNTIMRSTGVPVVTLSENLNSDQTSRLSRWL